MTTGDMLGPYKLGPLLGRGGMGEVYRAFDTRLNRDVAIKILPADFADDPDRVRRFQKEARAAGALSHPNILAVFDVGLDVGQAGDTPYLVTELLEGAPLRERMDQGRLSLTKIADYGKQTAAGLAAAHDKGIFHRDIKPENLFLTKHGLIKILDFGLAKTQSREEGFGQSSALTVSGSIVGTIPYMSPEQILGKAIDGRSDLFSLGSVLYEMAAGVQPFRAGTSVGIMNAIVSTDPVELSTLNPEIPAALDQVVRHCLEKSPDDRFQSVRDLVFALNTLVGGHSVGHSVMQGAQPLAKAAESRSPRHLWTVLVPALCAAVAVTAVIAFAAGYWMHSRRQAPAETWAGVRLGGPAIAYGPRISPDGKMLAFLAFEDRQSQVAVMNPETGNWIFLTHDRTKGIAYNLCWSPDSSKIYFHRYFSGPGGIFSVPALGGEERMVWEDAGVPAVLPDGSLLGARLNAERKFQIYHFWPETGRQEALPAELDGTFFNSSQLRVFPDAREAVFFGRPMSTSRAELPWHYDVLDLTSGGSRVLAPELKPSNGIVQAIAVAPGGQSVLVATDLRDLRQVVAVPRSGRGTPEALFSLQAPALFLDAGPDGSVYVDQLEQPTDVLRFPASGGVPERLSGVTESSQRLGLMALPDGRVLLMTKMSGRWRLVAATAGKDPMPLVQTEEETAAPFAVLGAREFAFELGTAPNNTLAIASASDGRMVRRLSSTKGLVISSLSASPDGGTLYYVVSGSIWAIPSTGGEPRKVASGDEVVADPNGRELILVRHEKDAFHLVRMSLRGDSEAGPEAPIPFQSEFRFSGLLSPNAINSDGRILVYIQSADSWWDQVGILDPKTGKVKKLDIPYSGDIDLAGWTRDGRIVAQGIPMRSSLWRFRKETP